jgi:hypothetical protein
MCCGSPRQIIPTGARRQVEPFGANPQQNGSVQMQAAALAKPVFEYVGATALTVVSPLTRKTYRFERPGARLEIDARDRACVAFVPNLARVGL